MAACVTGGSRWGTSGRRWGTSGRRWGLSGGLDGQGGSAPAAIAYAVYASSYAGLWLAVCATTGYTFHLLGDACTVEGVPFAFPLSRHKMALPLLGHTDSTREQVVGACMCLGLLAALIFFSAMPAIEHLSSAHHQSF
ncbi:MAG: metal-dependent hydrolase [Acidimicrobiales bacterium]